MGIIIEFISQWVSFYLILGWILSGIMLVTTGFLLIGVFCHSLYVKLIKNKR